MSRSLLCVLDHPTPYDPPLWECLVRRGNLRPLVFYSNLAIPTDREIGVRPEWGRIPGKGYPLFRGPYSKLLAELVRGALRVDAVLTSGWTRPRTWGVTAAARARGVPVVLPTDKVAFSRPARGRFRLAHAIKNRVFEGFFTTGIDGAKALELEGVQREQIATGLYPVDLAWWEQKRAEQSGTAAELRAWAGEGAAIVLAVSKLNAREAPFTLLDAFEKLYLRIPSARFVFVGTGPLLAAAKSRVQSAGLGDVVRLTGYVDYERLAGFYGAADVFVHAADLEPWGISVAEALACGVPIVATQNIGAARHLVSSPEVGVLAASGDASAIASALEFSLSRPTSGRGAAIRAAAQRMDVESTSEQLESLVHRIASNSRRAPLRVVLRRAMSGR